MKAPVSFHVEQRFKNSLARAGVLDTLHGRVETPAFVAVGTKATVKGITPEALTPIGTQILIANAYHLYLEAGEEVIRKGGGLAAFMGWNAPTMTDSGGFQVFSLGVGFGKKLSKFLPEQASHEEAVAVFDEDLATSHGKLAVVDEEGVSFTSHLDGSLHRFTPERSIEIQHAIGADIMFAFDECTAPTAEHSYQKEAMERTHRWAERSLRAHRQNLEASAGQGLFGIVQGGRFEDLRIESAKTLSRMEFDGYGIGGSFSKRDIIGLLEKVDRELPEEKPRHLLGIGEPEDMFEGVSAGVDLFDCVLPTRNGRTGTLYSAQGKINITNALYREDFSPIDTECGCSVCRDFTRAYIHHLFQSREMLGPILATTHNLYFLTQLARRIRTSILSGSFDAFKLSFLERYH
ncbi:MAG: tRNA guanosine(34) transglycosylase Tgt [Patescibacteria group bacterium]|nr:tRNA guanosine(34) transglycosylase Tgt [Patescibacteria group bacterium]